MGRAGTVLLLGRSGTGKTICVAKKMSLDRLEGTGRWVGGVPASDQCMGGWGMGGWMSRSMER
eukprot:3846356-Rhodomonas_salina.2